MKREEQETGSITLKQFASEHRLRMKRDDCGDLNIFGKRGEIYEYGSGVFGVTILHAPTAQHWNTYRKKFKEAGGRITQDGDTEGTAVFDPTNAKHTKLAIEAIVAKRKRQLTSEQKEILRGRLSFGRKTHFEVSAMVNPPEHAEDVFLRAD